MVFHRYQVYGIGCGAFSLKRTCVSTPKMKDPFFNSDMNRTIPTNVLTFTKLGCANWIPKVCGLGITAKAIKFAKLSSTENQKITSYEETELEDSHHAVASTRTEAQLEGIEWKLYLKSSLSLYGIKRVGDQCTNWITRTLREYNYDPSDLPADPALITFEDIDPENPQKRCFTIAHDDTSDRELRNRVVKWVVMSEHQGLYNVPEIPAPRRLWTIPRQYLENRNSEKQEREAASSRREAKAKTSGRRSLAGSWGEEPGQKKRRRKKKQEQQEYQEYPEDEEELEKQQKQEKREGKKPEKRYEKKDEERYEKKDVKKDVKKDFDPEDVPVKERWWEPTLEEVEQKRREEAQRKPGRRGEELWKKRQKEKEEENRKRVEAGGEDRWWDYEDPPNPTGWW
ncbi:uncharacterized protein DFL_007135 [Arthrobotrys flagrans]|uniref:Uncharacterized protein n=1 Tax=Arthrobotrys flagrans TaxID=97331 RepID=A0A436ZUX4_ARTFL|nr:hypothetical protein DFL_007135 [Arthrobotrys flagrans]